METDKLFEAALALVPPWQVTSVDFDAAGSDGLGQLDIHLDFPRGSRFACPECGDLCPVHDTSEKRWRHLDFFQHTAYLHARMPRTDCPTDGVKQVEVPWARPGSGFTLLFEAYVMLMAAELPVAALGRAVGEHDTRLWRLIAFHVEEARSRVDMSEVVALSIDETSHAKGHRYVTLFADITEMPARVLRVVEGRRGYVFDAFRADLRTHGGDPNSVRDVCMDLAPYYARGVARALPQAEVTADRFHVMKLANKALETVRRREQKERPELKRSRYLWLHNPESLSDERLGRLEELRTRHLLTARAYELKLALQGIWGHESRREAAAYLETWCRWALEESGGDGAGRDGEAARRSYVMAPVAQLARTVRSWATEILNYYRRRITNAAIESINSLVQAARARARGYRNVDTFKTMIYLLAGRLRFDLPRVSHSR